MIGTLERPPVRTATGLGVWYQHTPSGAAGHDRIRHLAEAGRITSVALTGPVPESELRLLCDVLLPAYKRSEGRDGLISVPVAARTRAATAQLHAARRLAATVARPNLLAALPASDAGVAALTPLLGEGIGVRLGPVHSVTRYRQAVRAHLDGLELARWRGLDLTTLGSVAAFGVGGIDVEIDALLDRAGSHEAKALRGMAGTATARLARRIHADAHDPDASARWRALTAAGARPQQLVWTQLYHGVPGHRTADYLDGLAAPGDTVELCTPALESIDGPLPARAPQSRREEAEAHAFTERLVAYLRWFDIRHESVLHELDASHAHH
ncbi:transaldolase family protein [Streptomyces sp. BE303]|uniref:transaldolase family protein n=1 Tax=Streptomyces sp. BE303 TaxID=3002528 RepID=UPI002E75A878|nr:transaldolase family protein [Streptomyces sp. BE303]MED7948284.1 transaldolase family protein [Streptomyces sp. BE303]